MTMSFVGLLRTYESKLAALWDDLEDLLDIHYGPAQEEPSGSERLRLKLEECRTSLRRLRAQILPFVRTGGRDGMEASMLQRFAGELIDILTLDERDEAFELACGTTIVRVQNRILDEARRLAMTVGHGAGVIAAA